MSLKSKYLLGLVGFLTTILIASCGQNVCVAGLGRCEIPEDQRVKRTDIQTSGGPKIITALKSGFLTDRMEIARGSQITLVGFGGNAPYTFAIASGEGTGKVGAKDGVYEAPNAAALAKVKITDSDNTSVEIQIKVIAN